MWSKDSRRKRLLALAVILLAGSSPVRGMKGDFSRGHSRPSRSLPQPREHILLGRQVGVPRVIEERDVTDTVTRQIVYGARAPLWQLLSDGSSQYYHEDPRGNVVALTEGAGSLTAAAGDVLERVTYDPFGKPLFQDAANQDKRDRFGVLVGASNFQNTLLFGGLWYDPASSLRAATLNDDFGGWYMAASQYYNPNTGRHMTRAFPAGDPDRPVIVGRLAQPEVNPYAASGDAPVNTSGDHGNHELGHALGTSHMTTGGMVTGVRRHRPIRIRKEWYVPESRQSHSIGRVVRKKPGRTTYANITLKRGVISVSAGPTTALGSAGDAPQFLCCKEKFDRVKPHVNIRVVGGQDASSGPGIEHEDIGAPMVPGAIPGIEHEDIGVFALPGDLRGPPENGNSFTINSGSSMNRDSGKYCYDPPWSPPMCCGWSKCDDPGCKQVEVCVYF